MIILLFLPHLLIAKDKDAYHVFGKFEYGFLGLLQHKSKWSKENPEFNYVKNGGQDLLFPTWRVESGFKPNKKNMFSFIYQPIPLETEVVLKEEVKIDQVIFEKNSDVLMKYDFSFYRFNYWSLLTSSAKGSFWVGGALQIRNADIRFTDRTGKNSFRTSSLGPVPLINFLYENNFSRRIHQQFKLAGFWAPIKYINGGTNDVNGWIYEFESQSKIILKNDLDAFVNFRVLGGGSEGTSKTTRVSGGNYTKDVLLTSSFTVGLEKNI